MAGGDISASLRVVLENDARAVPQPLCDPRPDRLAVGATLHSRDKMSASDARRPLACRFNAQPILSPEIPNRLAALIGAPWLAWPVRVSPGALPQDPHNPPPNQRLDQRIVVVPRRPHLDHALAQEFPREEVLTHARRHLLNERRLRVVEDGLADALRPLGESLRV